MTSYTLAVNAGSSSIKFSLFVDAANPSHSRDSELERVAHGSVKGIGGDKVASLNLSYVADKLQCDIDEQQKAAKSKHDRPEKTIKQEVSSEASYEQVFNTILDTLKGLLGGDLAVIRLVAHRIVHGGSTTQPIVIHHHTREESEVLARMEKLTSFAPLHNTNAMKIVRTTLHSLPHATSVVTFDTLFHASIAAAKYTYPVPPTTLDSAVPIRKYGFHGLSYASILAQMAKHLGKKEKNMNLVVAHLGAGSSVCAIKNGKSWDTTMGLTPLEGLPGATRSGSIDPALIFHHTLNASALAQNQSISKAEIILNTQSGFKALAGTSDFADVTQRAEMGEERALQCYDLFLDRVSGFIISYLSQLLAHGGHVDGVVFAGGIGENAAGLRRDLMQSVAWIEDLRAGGHGSGGIDESLNKGVMTAAVHEITRAGSYIKGWVVATDEELEAAVLARHAVDPAEALNVK